MVTRIIYNPLAKMSAASITDTSMEGHVVIYDHRQGNIQDTIKLTEDCGRAFCLSDDGKFLATGYWYKKGIDIWDLGTKNVLHTLGPSNVSGVLFDKTARFIVYHSESGTYAHAINDSESERIYHCEDIEGCSLSESNELFIPINRKGKIVICNFQPLSSSVIDLEISAKLHWIRHSPDSKSFFVIDSSKNIHCYDAKTKAKKWEVSLKKHAKEDYIFVGTYSGDGELIGLTVTERSGFRTIVLDSQNGEITKIIPGIGDSGYPFAGKTILSEFGKNVNLNDGSVSPGISDSFE